MQTLRRWTSSSIFSNTERAKTENELSAMVNENASNKLGERSCCFAKLFTIAVPLDEDILGCSVDVVCTSEPRMSKASQVSGKFVM